MNAIAEILLSPLGTVVLMVAVGATLVLFVLTRSDSSAPDPLERLRNQARSANGSTRRSLKQVENRSGIFASFDRFKAMLEPADKEDYSKIRHELLQAGYHGRHAVRDFHAVKFILAVSGLLLGLAYTLVLFPAGEDASILGQVIPVLVPTLGGYYLPVYWVAKRRDERQEQLSRGFPDALDMMLICAEAGQSLDQSMSRVAKEMHVGYPALAEELDTVTHQLKAGRSRIEVLRDLGERSGNADIKSFVTVLIQSATYGTSVSEALRVYAAEMRDKRVMLAEEKANVLPTKLTLGTMMFTVPPLLIILIGPSVHGVIEMLASADFNP